MARKKKSIWRSKSFLTGLSTFAMLVVLAYDIPIKKEILEGFFGLVTLVLIGKSVNKRM